VWPGFNDLETLYPELAEQWHPTKNGNLKPNHVCSKSNIKAWWYLPYDDPKTGKRFDFEWESSVESRTRQGYYGPILSGNEVWKGFNDLETLFPEIANEWHESKNFKKTPSMFMAFSGKKVWWRCENGHEWRALVYSRTGNGTMCPYCAKNENR
jgi:hypothetical protein